MVGKINEEVGKITYLLLVRSSYLLLGRILYYISYMLVTYFESVSDGRNVESIFVHLTNDGRLSSKMSVLVRNLSFSSRSRRGTILLDIL